VLQQRSHAVAAASTFNGNDQATFTAGTGLDLGCPLAGMPLVTRQLDRVHALRRTIDKWMTEHDGTVGTARMLVDAQLIHKLNYDCRVISFGV
jgi:hypothetical protein